MIYKVLLTTTATRGEAVSVKTDVLEFDEHSAACRAIERLKTSYSVGFASVDQRAKAINFSHGG